MLKHHELSGDELHNARVSIEPPTRSPAWIGETVFDGSVLWVAIGLSADTWRRAIPDNATSPVLPPIFSWSLNLSSVILFAGVLSLYYADIQPTQLNQWTSWTLLRRYNFGSEVPTYNQCISLNSHIEQRGTGLYMPLLSSGNPVTTVLAIAAANPTGSVQLVNVGRWTEPGTARTHQSAIAFAVNQCQATFICDVLAPFG